MIGCIYSSVIPYYDSSTGQNSYKKRPVLIISGPRNNDYTILPVSTISRRENRDPVYDVEINPAKFPDTHLNRVSYVRTHKQTTVHRASLTTKICDLKSDYEDLYKGIIEKLEEFHQQILCDALS